MVQSKAQTEKVKDRLSSIRGYLDQGEYSVVVKECCSLFEMSFKRIFKESLSTFNYQDRLHLTDAEKEIGGGKKDVDNFTFGELVGLNEKSHLLSTWASYNNRELGLIKGIRFNAIVDLRNSLTHTDADMSATCSRYDAELVYNCLMNMLATFGTIIIGGPEGGLMGNPPIGGNPPADGSSGSDTEDTEMVNIALNRKRGLIINLSDKTRNISYKVDTINRMLSVVYTKVSELNDEATAAGLLYDMGYDSGSAFGRVMNEKWELKDDLSLNDKITLWCDFDSEVGWGRFVNNLMIDEDAGTITGTIDINESFLCYNRKKNDVKICDFLRGYCEGVLEELLGGQQVKLTCSGNGCPLKSALKKKCSYAISLVE